ncbi:steroid 17-alpha-hydroxylase/17,20 lyase-like [Oppia nitens]|uniref:steroid 17-alpha-hydroxylase/17,20 lyase-like n=1 Tax=Oppia nitens TaxID=1686743 RepID=UPI0023DC4648|nr:steroid 17-alpha-hydroxylase/17,20 lyase-like [Oppia nitens]
MFTNPSKCLMLSGDYYHDPFIEELASKTPNQIIVRTQLSHTNDIRMSFGQQINSADCVARVLRHVQEIINDTNILQTNYTIVYNNKHRKWKYTNDDSLISQLYATKEFGDIGASDYDKRWVALRRVGHKAIVNYSTNNRYVQTVCDCVDSTILAISETESVKPFQPNGYLFLMSMNIINNTLFRKSIGLTDDEYSLTKLFSRDIISELGSLRILLDVSPVFSWLLPGTANKLLDHIRQFNDLLANSSDNAGTASSSSSSSSSDNNNDDNVDLCDSLIQAKRDGIRDNKQWSQYLTDKNLSLIVSNLYDTGVLTFDDTTQWMLLLMTYYPRCQLRLRTEIMDNIGGRQRLPRHDDRQQCHYVMAFIAETLRFVSLFSFYHKSMEISTIDKYTIPKGTSLIIYLRYIMHNKTNWPNSDQFQPERFIDPETGHYMANRLPQFVPFGIGARQCVAEKLTIAGLFLVCVRFIQSTKQIVLSDSQGIGGHPGNSERYVPYPYKLVIEPNL